MKKFHIGTFLLATLGVVILTFLSFIAVAGQGEGNPMNTFWLIFAKLFYVFSFPTIILFGNFVSNWALMFGGLFINCVLYGILIERTMYLFKKRRSIPTDI